MAVLAEALSQLPMLMNLDLRLNNITLLTILCHHLLPHIWLWQIERQTPCQPTH